MRFESSTTEYASTFDEVLTKSEETMMKCSNPQKLMIETYACTNYISPTVLTELFAAKENSSKYRKYQHPRMDKVPYHVERVLFVTLLDSINTAQNI